MARDRSATPIHSFPKSYDLMWSYIEGPDAVKQYHDELKANVRTTHDKVIREVESFEEKAGFECSSYKLSREMQDFAHAIRRLAYMEGGLQRAVTLDFALGKPTYSHLPSVFGGYTYRSIDLLTARLILEFAKLSKQECPGFDAEDIMLDINPQIQYLRHRNIYTYMPRSYKLPTSWRAGAKAKEKEEKQRFMAAIKLLLFLGKQSFSTLPGLEPMYGSGKVPYLKAKFVYGEVGKQVYECLSGAQLMKCSFHWSH
jgi:hypothetical protein